MYFILINLLTTFKSNFQRVNFHFLNVFYQVYDFDRFMVDDFMGSVCIDLDRLRLFEWDFRTFFCIKLSQHYRCHEFKLELHEEGNDEYMGYIHVAVTVRPLTQPQADAVHLLINWWFTYLFLVFGQGGPRNCGCCAETTE